LITLFSKSKIDWFAIIATIDGLATDIDGNYSRETRILMVIVAMMLVIFNSKHKHNMDSNDTGNSEYSAMVTMVKFGDV
jgi:hypothetical protein